MYKPYFLFLGREKAGNGWMGGDALPGKKEVDKTKLYKHINDRPPEKLMVPASRRLLIYGVLLIGSVWPV